MAYHCITHPERPYRQKWYYVGGSLLLKVVMASFARFLGLEVESLYFWLYGHAIKLDEAVSNVCYTVEFETGFTPFLKLFKVVPLFLITLVRSWLALLYTLHKQHLYRCRLGE